LASEHLLGSAGYAELASDLKAASLTYLNTEYPTGALLNSGRGIFLSTSGEANAREFEGFAPGDGAVWLADRFQSPEIGALLAPWVLHAGLSPDAAGSGFMVRVMSAAFQMGGMPIPQGGGDRLVQALQKVILSHGGTSPATCLESGCLLADGFLFGFS